MLLFKWNKKQNLKIKKSLTLQDFNKNVIVIKFLIAFFIIARHEVYLYVNDSNSINSIKIIESLKLEKINQNKN